MSFWHDSGSSKRSSQVDPWRWNPEVDALACFRVFKLRVRTSMSPLGVPTVLYQASAFVSGWTMFLP
eukprot:6466816-Pyramimonas_sp.AAC.1